MSLCEVWLICSLHAVTVQLWAAEQTKQPRVEILCQDAFYYFTFFAQLFLSFRIKNQPKIVEEFPQKLSETLALTPVFTNDVKPLE